MKHSIRVVCALATVSTALAQSNPRRGVPGEIPAELRNGKARYTGRFDAKQMLRLTIGLTRPHPDEEDRFILELGTPGSPNYRKFLPQEEFIARFGPSKADEQALVDWVESQGFTITKRFRNRLLVDVEAPAATIEHAFKVTLNNYAMDGYTYFSNEREPVIPAHLVPVIQSISGFHNFAEVHPSISHHGPVPPRPVYNPGPVVGIGHHVVIGGERPAEPQMSAAALSPSDSPQFTGGFIDFKNISSSQAYNYDGLHHLNTCCNPLNNPAGSPPESSIAIAAFGQIAFNGTTFPDILGFHNLHPTLAFNLTTIPVDGGPSSCSGPGLTCANDGETTLDAEWAGAMSNSFGTPNSTAQIFVYQGGGSIEDVYQAMLDDGHARTFTTSFGIAESQASSVNTRHGIFNQMANAGWSLMAAAGDGGATADCSTLSVQYPASDWDIIAVGGTFLGLNPNGTFGTEVAWTGSNQASQCAPPTNNGGGGGGCSTIFSLQPWQQGANGTCGGQRSIPDMALNSADSQDIFFNGSLFGVGGTSIASPMLAGFFAQANAYMLHVASLTGNNCGTQHGLCSPIGYATPLLYDIGRFPDNAPHYPFYDITQGCNSNGVTIANSLQAFCAGPGYDVATDWGSANMLQLAWAISTWIAGDSAPPNVSFSGPNPGQYYNTSQTLKWTVTDVSTTGANPVGVAGFSTNWDADPGDDIKKATPGTGSNWYAGPTFPLATSGSAQTGSTTSGEGCHYLHVRVWDNSGFTQDQVSPRMCFDDIPPSVSCGHADGAWHASDVSIPCTASDANSGLVNPADASFSLVTSVPAGTETANAVTNSHSVVDVAENSTTVGPIAGNKVDKKPPAITITQPVATTYQHSDTLTLNYSVTDGGSGVATVTPTMNGSGTVGGQTIVNGLAIDLLTALPLGPNTFSITAVDNVGNSATVPVTFTIIVTAGSMAQDIGKLQADGAITGNTNSLMTKLASAAASRSAGNCTDAGNQYTAFINEVQAQTGKTITAQAAAILIADAQYLITHCP